MPWLYEMAGTDKCGIWAAVVRHYRARGVPDSKINRVCYRWIAKNGWRAPNV